MSTHYLGVNNKASRIPVKSVSTSSVQPQKTISTSIQPQKTISSKTRATTTPKPRKTSSSTSSNPSSHWLTHLFQPSKKTIKSVVRLVTEQEKSRMWHIDPHSIRYMGSKTTKKFELDHVFGSTTTNQQLYQQSIESTIEAFMQGYNILGTIFTYGQPGTGKTYFVKGNDHEPGIVFYSSDTIFNWIKNDHEHEYIVCLSLFEIVNEVIRDLLDEQGQPLKISDENKRRGPFVSLLKEQVIRSPQEIEYYVQLAQANRYMSTTNYDMHCSRAHTFVQWTLERRLSNKKNRIQRHRDTIQISHLYLVDLASNDKSIYQSLKNPIHKSCLALEAIVHNLSETGKSAGHPLPPYHDSKLTRLLQPMFMGQHHVVSVCTVNMKAAKQDDIPTLDTLLFATRIKRIPISPKLTEISEDKSLLVKYTNEINLLLSKLEKLDKQKQSGIQSILEKRLYHTSQAILTAQSFLHRQDTPPLHALSEEGHEKITQLEAELNMTRAELQVTQLLVHESHLF
ncbi:kinesin motor domain-containing protein [Gilbertella persicaria]|uniref:kinesin motor domain-containing protein n=1 Tax=Gilbertella persicaria TaxID=101096 RepID=UPI00221E5873|nr:kinesin motor domain-containing protein [Gilbertella persicaria]KAI8091322.1 kinesin motor domain-containing protein [Gilbertella persicaria]